MRTRSKGGTPRIPRAFDRMRRRVRRRAARHGAGGRALRQAARLPALLAAALSDFLVPVPRQHMLSDCMIVPGLYQAGPNPSASENLWPRVLRRYRRTPPFLVDLLQYPRTSAFLRDGHFAPAISPTAASRAAAKPSRPEIRRIGRTRLRSLPVDTRNRCGRKTRSCRSPMCRICTTCAHLPRSQGSFVRPPAAPPTCQTLLQSRQAALQLNPTSFRVAEEGQTSYNPGPKNFFWGNCGKCDSFTRF